MWRGGGSVVCVMEGGQRRVKELDEMEWNGKSSGVQYCNIHISILHL